MTGYLPKSASSNRTWVWVAVAAITLASLARAQSSIEQARAYATPVIKFLAASQLAESGDFASVHRAVAPSQAGTSALALELLPVFFVGLIAPLSLYSANASFSIGSARPVLGLPNLSQRPPPAPLA